MQDFDLVVIGAGVAGLTAATFAAHYGLKVAVVERMGAGGQIVNAESIENFPGFPAGIEARLCVSFINPPNQSSCELLPDGDPIASGCCSCNTRSSARRPAHVGRASSSVETPAASVPSTDSM